MKAFLSFFMALRSSAKMNWFIIWSHQRLHSVWTLFCLYWLRFSRYYLMFVVIWSPRLYQVKIIWCYHVSFFFKWERMSSYTGRSCCLMNFPISHYFKIAINCCAFHRNFRSHSSHLHSSSFVSVSNFLHRWCPTSASAPPAPQY